MSQVKLIVSNWKMNLNFIQTRKLINGLKKIKFNSSTTKNIICPQFLLIPLVSELIKKTNILVGAQDCHQNTAGAFTGDTSVELLKKMNCKYVIVGHSERRQYHNETDDIIKQKVDLILSFGIKPIICVGESLKDRKNKKYTKVIKEQLSNCIPFGLNNVIIAYEPIWSIGTGLVPTIEEIVEIHDLTTNFLKKSKKINQLNFLYGGSVNADNFMDIMQNTNINGALIGGSSLKINEMNKILTFC